ncbi:unnamed protein product [Chondrus crispus]|uniref:Uncharacterized protein n=1 Tax=Chondrus crispus TaxID=2769 RepID=R7QJC2_CHOCR|nr:unnamed protein product [Chondrus crispus]CDF37490.1 unnamed protein product [Chondrus crispus]|eukprot:XP_005717361.1 unnamed protein product [Chondrus crispus]
MPRPFLPFVTQLSKTWEACDARIKLLSCCSVNGIIGEW